MTRDPSPTVSPLGSAARAPDATEHPLPAVPTVVLKLGGELVEAPRPLADLAATVAALAAEARVVIVHGGGREIDLELTARGLTKQAVDGLRITDSATLDIVVGVIAGRVSTRLVAAATAAGVPAVGLTAIDAMPGAFERAPGYRSSDGRTIDLGFVGQPTGVRRSAPLLRDLCALGYVPIVACIGSAAGGQILNLNADTLAAQVAVQLGARRLIVAGATPGVRDAHGRTIARLSLAEIEPLVRAGHATAGMVAKLTACRDAVAGGVARVTIVDGREPAEIASRADTEIVRDPSAPPTPAPQRGQPS